MSDHPEHPEQDFRIVRLLAALEAIPDPVERARECLTIGDQVRTIHGRLGEIRRRAVYEATLHPGATGRSVAAALGVSPKAVSQASSEYRQQDLLKFDAAVDALAAQFGDADPDICQLLATKRSTRSVTLLARALLGVYSKWILAGSAGPDEAAFGDLYGTFERAQYVCDLAKVTTAAHVGFKTLAHAGEPDYRDVPPELVWAVRVLNALPGIRAFGTVYDYDGQQEWSLGWNILPAERYTSVFDAGPDAKGFAVTEWLVWLARDFERSGFSVWSRMTSPPPYLNEPGESLSFLVEGVVGTERNHVTATAFVEALIEHWDGVKSGKPAGYWPVEWPQEQAAPS
jgi:hypothetical protein